LGPAQTTRQKRNEQLRVHRRALEEEEDHGATIFFLQILHQTIHVIKKEDLRERK
jgi:hypothetical protein